MRCSLANNQAMMAKVDHQLKGAFAALQASLQGSACSEEPSGAKKTLPDPTFAKYTPEPLFMDFEVPPLDDVVEACAVNNHQDWRAGKLRAGWSHGNALDHQRREHPDIVDWEQLSITVRSSNMGLARQTIKVIYCVGCTLERNDTSSGMLSATRSPMPPPNVSDMAYVAAIKVPEALVPTIAIMAFHRHEVWAEQKKAAGYSYGPERNEELKHDPRLVPFWELPSAGQEVDRSNVSTCLKTVLACGYSILSAPTQTQWTEMHQNNEVHPALGVF
jgi:hypothetical protein